MPTCPKGHDSVATDYCDECGTPMGAHQPPAVPVPPTSASAESGPCPQCGTPRSGRFCERCGYDFLLAPDPRAAGEEPPPELPRREGRPLGWRVVVAADREYYERMRAVAVPGAPDIPFPAYCPERRFPLSAGQVLIGRHSRKRGIEPDIDLTGPPEDGAVSHTHAVLVPGADGGWSVVDLHSANGTYLNGSTEEIEPDKPVPLQAGDQIHVGAWTTLTVQREETAR